MRKRGLGRGLDALLGTGAGGGGEAHETAAEGALRPLAVDQIVPNRYQPRQHIDQERLRELADSIRVQGLIQPIVVRAAVAGRYEIIAGERRWRAAQLAGLDTVPALVREVDERAAMALALIENIQREDLNPMEEAHALQRLIDAFELTHQQAAEAIGRSRAAVSNLLRLLDLSPEVQRLVQDDKLEMGHARALLPLPSQLQQEAARQVLLRGLSVRETETLVKHLQSERSAKPTGPAPDPNVRHLQEDLAERLGARVLVQHTASGKGRLVIHYNTLDELDGILSHVK